MATQPIITGRMRRNAAWLLVAFIVIVAIINVPWALTRMQSRLNWNKPPVNIVLFDNTGRPWPSDTPHATPWPDPNYFELRRLFGNCLYNVKWQPSGDTSSTQHFSMQVQHLGWPLPVIEQKQMWWDWSDPKLRGPENDAALSLLWPGLILNPLLVGGGAWLAVIALLLGPTILKRWYRQRHHRCLSCGYLVGESLVCTECGQSLPNRRIRAAV